jgi:hypothetical protein
MDLSICNIAGLYKTPVTFLIVRAVQNSAQVLYASVKKGSIPASWYWRKNKKGYF